MTLIAPDGTSTSRSARRPASGSGRWCSTPVQTMWSKPRPRSAARSTASWRNSRLSRAYLSFKALRERDTFGADVDSDDLGARPAQRVMGGLGGAAAGDQYAAVVATRLVRPEEMGIGAPAMVIPEPAVGLQIVHRRRVRMTLVEGGHLRGNVGALRCGNFVVAHAALEDQAGSSQGPFPAWAQRSSLGKGPMGFVRRLMRPRHKGARRARALRSKLPG